MVSLSSTSTYPKAKRARKMKFRLQTPCRKTHSRAGARRLSRDQKPVNYCCCDCCRRRIAERKKPRTLLPDRPAILIPRQGGRGRAHWKVGSARLSSFLFLADSGVSRDRVLLESVLELRPIRCAFRVKRSCIPLGTDIRE